MARARRAGGGREDDRAEVKEGKEAGRDGSPGIGFGILPRQSSTGTSQAILEKALRSAAGKRSHHPLLISWPPSYLGGAGAANTLGESDVFVHKFLTGKGDFHASSGVAGGVLLAVTTLSTLLGMWLASPGVSSAKAVGISDEEEVPENVDWTAEGAVTIPQDQCLCGGCWAYASVGSMEGLHMIRNGELVNLSVQQVLDCAKRVMRHKGDVQVIIGKGCSAGGQLYHAYDYAKNHGLMTAKAYPSRLLWHGKCRSREKDVVLKIDDYNYVNSNEKALMRAVAKQPVAVPIDVCPYLRGFKGDGIIEYHNCRPAADGDRGARSHAVLVVGYGTDEEGNKFWKIKNSWGTWWGDGGFAKLRRGVADKNGVAGITRYLGYIPIIDCKK